MTECPDLEFFTLRSVQILIDNHYHYWYKINLFSIVVPAILQSVLFWFWNNFVLTVRLRDLQLEELSAADQVAPKSAILEDLPQYHEDMDVGDLNALCRVLLFIITLYLFLNDFYIMALNMYQMNEKDTTPKIFLQTILKLALHILIL